ncbi:asparagine synthase [Salinisphaera dokdonensis CL-ES53]|uniref:asparagine synthase (glutamine-hydrolyzing) n=2 Tax=Salinisphaera TaxID=180541 RepID=A0ABV2B496_9GAMM
MADVQAHRGPDQGGKIALSGAGLSHRRLSILDASTGQQPMQSEDGRFTLVYNGEIYNYRELNGTLAGDGYRFAGHCDTETLLRAWQHSGVDCVSGLRGMFAFAVWDAGRRRLFLARDRLGIKPLYYGFTRDRDLVFGSELKALLVHPRLERKLDSQALEAYLALGYVPDPLSIFQTVRKLEPGHTLSYDANSKKVQLNRYWDVDFAEANTSDFDSDAAELLERVDDTVRMRLVADVPLGAFLSGGVDSSAVVASMARQTGTPVNTCAIGFDNPAFDETEHALLVARHLGTQHRDQQVAVGDHGLIDRLTGIYDEPFADSSALPTYRVCELARRQVKVALSGDGGDENFAGYRRYRMHWAESRARARVPERIRRPLFGALGQAYPKLDWAPRALRAKSTLQSLAMSTAEGYCHGVSMIPQALRETLYSTQFTRELQGYRASEIFRAHAANAGTDHPLSLAQYLDFKTYLPGDILTKVDRASMAHGLEVRVPLLDHELVSWAARLPATTKLRRGETKAVLKRAFEPLLPHDILYRQKKGFSVPLAEWFRGPLTGAAREALAGGALTDSGLFDPSALVGLLDDHVSGRADHATPLWSLLMLSRFLESQGGVARADNGTPNATELRRHA